MPEGQWFDFKSAQLLREDRKRLRREMRKDLSAFANADGGFLIIGLDSQDITS